METIDLTEQTKALDVSVNEAFHGIAAMSPFLGKKVEKLGARFESAATVSPTGIDIKFTLKMDNVDTTKHIDMETTTDILLVEALAQKFAERNLNR